MDYVSGTVGGGGGRFLYQEGKASARLVRSNPNTTGQATGVPGKSALDLIERYLLGYLHCVEPLRNNWLATGISVLLTPSKARKRLINLILLLLLLLKSMNRYPKNR
ncbi:hypothetical protein SAY86_003668 [Trapa natans]|uniref:Uncharacterized protein n=1 Tax=Trapa natans TaxID=22666 RepID=A0AAN7RN09_TRANT|nr:hypothetical protein SAY86_003668 [Trapa natans]